MSAKILDVWKLVSSCEGEQSIKNSTVRVSPPRTISEGLNRGLTSDGDVGVKHSMQLRVSDLKILQPQDSRSFHRQEHLRFRLEGKNGNLLEKISIHPKI